MVRPEAMCQRLRQASDGTATLDAVPSTPPLRWLSGCALWRHLWAHRAAQQYAGLLPANCKAKVCCEARDGFTTRGAV
eukprot:6169864-Prymnesium_polylepis.2